MWSSLMAAIWIPSDQPLTAPDVRPATILRWKTRTRAMTGMVTTTEAAAIAAVGCWKNDSPVKNASAAGTVRARSLAGREMPKAKSFPAEKKGVIAAGEKPGAAPGAENLSE